MIQNYDYTSCKNFLMINIIEIFLKLLNVSIYYTGIYQKLNFQNLYDIYYENELYNSIKIDVK